MRVLFSHFYNEEYLLPWWLEHHRQMFDHGVLIDYGSTDRSVEICRELVPSWEIVNSQNARFEALMCDHEVMVHEARFEDAWKIVLNTTEFLISPSLSDVEQELAKRDAIAGILPGAIMADISPEDKPNRKQSLLEQKAFGVWESDFIAMNLRMKAHRSPSRSRIYHRYKIGAYTPGRHTSSLPGKVEISSNLASVRWFGYSPWTPEFLERKAQIESKRADFDKQNRLGEQHAFDVDELDRRRNVFLGIGYNLSSRQPKKRRFQKIRRQILKNCIRHLARS